jgi:serine/threonine protein kinase
MSTGSNGERDAISGLRVAVGRRRDGLGGHAFRRWRSAVSSQISISAPSNRHDEESLEFEFPHRFGRFEARSCIGVGGAGVVCESIHVDSGKRAAVKTARLPLPQYHAAIRREATTLAQCSHRGIVSVFQSSLEQDRPWFAMELLRGRTLRSLMEHAERMRTLRTLIDERVDPEPGSSFMRHVPPVPLVQALRITEEICQALAYLHERGFVHCDVKPENVFVRDDARVVLLDFGAAHPLDDEPAAGEDDWTTFGTWAYMAPECRVGAARDQRADAFSLGCVLHELAVGVRPHLDHSRRGVMAVRKLGFPSLDSLIAELIAFDAADRPRALSDCARRLRELSAALESSRRASPALISPIELG